jgi:hypothetical protein
MTGVEMIFREEARKALRRKSHCNKMPRQQNSGAKEKSGLLFSRAFLLRFHFRQVLLMSVQVINTCRVSNFIQKGGHCRLVREPTIAPNYKVKKLPCRVKERQIDLFMS